MRYLYGTIEPLPGSWGHIPAIVSCNCLVSGQESLMEPYSPSPFEDLKSPVLGHAGSSPAPGTTRSHLTRFNFEGSIQAPFDLSTLDFVLNLSGSETW